MHSRVKPKSLPDVIDILRPSVVRVLQSCKYQTGSVRAGGTAFLVGKNGFALTAAHVINPCPASIPGSGANPPSVLVEQEFSIGLPVVHSTTDQTNTRQNFTFVDAEVIKSDTMHDVALLRLRINPFTTPIESGYTLNGQKLPLAPLGSAEISTRKLREGESIAISGYPLDIDAPVFDTNVGIVASTHSSREFSLPTYFNSSMDQFHVSVTFDLYEADLHVNPGNSGGPVYDVLTGKVVGLCSAYRPAPIKESVNGQVQDSTYRSNSGLAVIVPIAYATILMSQQGIEVPKK